MARVRWLRGGLSVGEACVKWQGVGAGVSGDYQRWGRLAEVSGITEMSKVDFH